ncbi:MAG: hypothetical protein ABEI11_03375 [Haloarculaceae archaeon]
MPSDDSYPPGTALAVLALLAVAAVMPASTTAHPPTETDHGVPERTFHRLWSNDHDAVGERARLAASELPVEELASGTDLPLDAPPRAGERWNRGDHRQFPATNRSVSIHPSDANLTDGRFVRDAHATVFTVQSATRARLSPTNQPLYVAPNGTLLGTVDYRVVVPNESRSEDRRVSWALASHRIRATRLLVDGRVVTNASGTHTPALAYRLGDDSDEYHTLTLTAVVAVELRKTVETCVDRENGTCQDWETSIEYPTENVTVRDSVEVVTYDLTVSGAVARYPNGDLGLVIYKSKPWLGYALPNGDVRGVWRIFTARDPDWDTLVYSTVAGASETHSPLHPLQVTAYPIETGPTPTPRRGVRILDVYGWLTRPPSLPPEVRLDVLQEPYTASYGIATRARTSEPLRTVSTWGLVRGVRVNQSVDAFSRVRIRRSNLTLTVTNTTDDTITVQVQLEGQNSETPIDTADRPGYVVLDGRRVNTTDDGTATVQLARSPAGVSARYVPGQWWRTRPAFVGDADTVLVRAPLLDLLETLYEIGVPVALFLLAGFIIDRFTGWRLWPPWRRL